MKILIIATQDKGGAGKACVRQHLALLAAGFEVRLLLLQREDSAIPSSAVFEPRKGVWRWLRDKVRTRYYFWQRRKALEGRPEPPEPFQFLGSPYEIEQHEWCAWADVIHLHWVARMLDEARFFRVWGKRKPIFWTLHDCLPFSGGWHYEIGFPKAAYAEVLAQQEEAKAQALAGSKLEIITLCEWMAEKAKASRILGAFKQHRVPNSLNLEIFKLGDKLALRQALGLPLERKLLLFVADSVRNPRKGFALLLEALALAKLDADLVILGNLDRSLLPETLQVHALGFVSEEAQMQRVYAACDGFVAPSLEDNLPNTVAEALCCGLPVLAFRLGGLPDMLEQGMGCLVAEASAQALAAALPQFITQTFDNQEIAKRAAQRYAPKKQVALLQAAYEGALADGLS